MHTRYKNHTPIAKHNILLFVIYCFFLSLFLSANAFAEKSVNATEIELADEADTRMYGDVDLIYSGSKFNVYLISADIQWISLMIVHDVEDDEPIVLTSEEPNGPFITGLSYDGEFVNEILEILRNNYKGDVPNILGTINLDHYVRGAHRPHLNTPEMDAPFVRGWISVRQPGWVLSNGSRIAPIDVWTNSFPTVKVALQVDEANRGYREEAKIKNAGLAEERRKKEQEARDKHQKRIADAAEARKGPVIKSASPPSGADIANAYINEALAYKYKLVGDRTLSGKGTDAGIKVEDATNVQCSPAGDGYQCSYVFRKERKLGAVLGIFGDIIGVGKNSNASSTRSDLFYKTKAGWKSPSIAQHLAKKKENWDSEMYELQKQQAEKNRQQWQEDALDAM